MKKFLLSAAVAGLLAAAQANAATFYFSTSNTAPTVGNPNITVDPGTTTTVYLWAQLDNQTATAYYESVNGIGLNITTDNSAGGTFTGATWNKTTRWNSTAVGAANGGGWAGFNASAVTKSGLDPSSIGYDNAATSSFLVGSFTFKAGTPSTTQVENLKLQTNSAVISFLDDGSGAYATDGMAHLGTGDAAVKVNTNGGGITSALPDLIINVPAVPEPASLGLLGLGVLGLAARRRQA